MNSTIYLWLFILILSFIIFITFFIIKKQIQLRQIELHKLQNSIKEVNQQYEELIKNKKNEQNNLELLQQTCNNHILTLETLKNKCDTEHQKYEQIQKQCAAAFDNYIHVLEQHYEDTDNEYEDRISSLKESYQLEENDLQQQIQEEKDKLQDIRNLRKAAQEAITREKEIKEQLNFYCLSIDDKDKNDIAILNKIKTQLAKPRVLSMLIWSTWFQKPMTSLCNNILGLSAVTGIYKITNVITNECYIGQATDVAARMKQHAKCGLGIDTPAGNKLYKAMQEYGIWNFSWELLEKCENSKLNERERYYIELYMSKDFGYNSNKGVK